MTVRKGTKVHPATFELVLKLKDELGFTYDDLSELTGVSPSRIQQIVLFQRKRGGQVDVNSGAGSQQAEAGSSTTT